MSKRAVIAFGLTLGVMPAWAASAVPLPPVRPHDAGVAPALPNDRPAQSQTAPAPPTAPQSATQPAQPVASAAEIAECDGILASGVLRAERLPPITGEMGCGVALPVKLTAIPIEGGRTVQLEPPVTIRCGLAAALAGWIRQDLSPLLAARHGGLAKLAGMGGYECRGRNRVVGAKLSEHASGNAVDIQSFVLADKTVAKITDVAKDDTLFAQVKLTTCARFSTVLGPGSDGYHEDNLHLDLEPRRSGKHFCRWQLP